MIHGFPGLLVLVAPPDGRRWPTQFQVVAIDQRGYNLSDKPKGVENYDMRLLVADVAAVIRHLGRDKATIVGHDWGGMVAWQFAMNLPQMTENLIMLNLPHPAACCASSINPEQIANSEYARTFQRGSPTDPTVFFGRPMTPQTLSGWVTRPRRAQALCRGVRALRLRRDAELLQGELSEGVRRRRAAGAADCRRSRRRC